MKNFCIIPILLFILFMLVYQCTSAQDIKDYVVNSKRDTIYGDVKPLLFGADKKVQVQTADKKKIVVPITQTLSFSKDGQIYQPVRSEKGYVFMKLIKEGYLSLYAYQLDNQITYDGRYLVKRDGSRLDIPNLSFKKLLAKFLSDCGDVSEKISSGELGKKDINQIIDYYNACVNGKTVETKKVITQTQEAAKKISSWDILEEKLKAEPDFTSKKDALDMVADIKGKISRSEKVPNFLLEGLKSALSTTNLKTELDNAIKDVSN